MNLDTVLVLINVWVDGNRVTTGFLLLMLLIFLTRTFQYRNFCRRYKKDINKLVLALDQPVEQIKEDGFKTVINSYDNTLLEHLKKNLIGKKAGYRNSDDVYLKDDYIYKAFDLDTFQKRYLEPLKYSNTSTTLVSLGVLGTFLGLILGVNDAAVGLASPDSTIARRSLESLLGGAGLAFITSLAGLSSGLLFTLITDTTKSGVLKKVGIYSELLQSKIPLLNSNNSNNMRESLSNIEENSIDSNKQITANLTKLLYKLDEIIDNQNKLESYHVKSLSNLNDKVEASNLSKQLGALTSLISKQLDIMITGQSNLNSNLNKAFNKRNSVRFESAMREDLEG